jgi:hypothetical protein
MTFREYIKIREFVDTPPLGNITQQGNVFGAVPASWTGTQVPTDHFTDPSPVKPGQTEFDLGLPTVTKTAQITFMDEKKNPVHISLSDGTQLFIPYDAFKRIKGEPGAGKTISIALQRRVDDKSGVPSIIKSIQVL